MDSISSLSGDARDLLLKMRVNNTGICVENMEESDAATESQLLAENESETTPVSFTSIYRQTLPLLTTKV